MSRPMTIRNEAILDAARKVFLKHGFQASTARVAKGAEPPVGAVRQNRTPRRGLLDWRTLRVPCLPRPQNCPDSRRNDYSKSPRAELHSS